MKNDETAYRFSRRQFSIAASGAALSSWLPCGLRADSRSPRKTFGLGFSLYGMKSLPIEDALQACADIGYDCVELPVQAAWPGDSKKLSTAAQKSIRAKLDETGLRLSSLMENLHAVVDDQSHRTNLDRLKSAGEVGHALSPKQPPVVETILGGRPAQWDEIKRKIADRLHDWARVAEEAKTVVAIKAHVGGAMHRPEHPVWIAKKVDSPWIKCAYDYSHFELRKIDMETSVSTLVPHSVFIHVKDSAGDAKKVKFLLPGEGKINYAKLLPMLVSAGYAGDILVEVSGQIHGKPGYKPIEAAQESYANLAPVFKGAGIVRG